MLITPQYDLLQLTFTLPQKKFPSRRVVLKISVQNRQSTLEGILVLVQKQATHTRMVSKEPPNMFLLALLSIIMICILVQERRSEVFRQQLTELGEKGAGGGRKCEERLAQKFEEQQKTAEDKIQTIKQKLLQQEQALSETLQATLQIFEQKLQQQEQEFSQTLQAKLQIFEQKLQDQQEKFEQRLQDTQTGRTKQ